MILMILPFGVMLSAGAATVNEVLESTQNMYINPLFPPRRERVCVQRAVCEQNSSELLPLLE